MDLGCGVPCQSCWVKTPFFGITMPVGFRSDGDTIRERLREKMDKEEQSFTAMIKIELRDSDMIESGSRVEVIRRMARQETSLSTRLIQAGVRFFMAAAVVDVIKNGGLLSNEITEFVGAVRARSHRFRLADGRTFNLRITNQNFAPHFHHVFRVLGGMKLISWREIEMPSLYRSDYLNVGTPKSVCDYIANFLSTNREEQVDIYFDGQSNISSALGKRKIGSRLWGTRNLSRIILGGSWGLSKLVNNGTESGNCMISFRV